VKLIPASHPFFRFSRAIASLKSIMVERGFIWTHIHTRRAVQNAYSCRQRIETHSCTLHLLFLRKSSRCLTYVDRRYGFKSRFLKCRNMTVTASHGVVVVVSITSHSGGPGFACWSVEPLS